MNLVHLIAAQLRRSPRGGPAVTRAQLGMTLIEIMVVVAIIGLLMGTVGVVAYRRYQSAKLTNARQVINNLQQALTHYRMETNENCPTDLEELYKQKFVTKKPKDPWGEKLMFKCPGEHDTEGADIWSKGPDKQDGTEDDITSWGDETEEE